MVHTKSKTTVIRMAGMHCPSCDVLVRTKLEELGNITQVTPDYKNKKVTIEHTGELSLDQINHVLCDYGYKASSLDEVLDEPATKDRLVEAVVIALMVGIVYYLATELNLLPENLAGAATSTLGAFVLGLIASASTCMATTGALFTAFLNKQQSKETQVVPLAGTFITGRVLGYGIFGFLIGLFGAGLGVITQLGSVFNLVVAVVLIVAGLDMLRLVSLGQLLSYLPKTRMPQVFDRLPVVKNPLARSFGIGFLTYFLPCGFTLSTQAYAITTGNPWVSAQIMVAFAIGTVPSLVFLTLLSKVRNATVYQYFLKVVGVVICIVGVGYVVSTLRLYGIAPTLTNQDAPFEGGVYSEMQEGKQIVRMTATSSGYSPNKFIVKKGVPVRWEIDGKEIYGCQGSLQSPQAGIQLTYLKEGENVFEFIPNETGIINFSCSMGMFSGQFKVIDG